MGYFYLFLFSGLFYFFGDVFLSGWDKIPGSLLDGNLINYILEHFYLFVKGSNSLHSSLWNLPIFYPSENALAFSDTMLSVAPLYIFFRLIFDHYISFSMTVICFSILNYTIFYFILRKLNYSKLLSSLGAFLYAFSYINKITHLHVQLIVQFYVLGAVLSLLYVSKRNSKRKNLLLFLTASTLYSLGMYSSFYTGFFVFLICLVAGLICLIIKKYRKILKIFFIRYKKEIIISLVWAVILLFPLAKIYLGTGISRPYNLILFNMAYLPVYFKGHSFIVKNVFPSMLEDLNIEYSLMFTYVLCIFGIIGLLRYKRYGKLLFLTFIISVLVSTKFEMFHDFSLWKFVYNVVPGAIGIREPIRIILILNPFLVLGFVKFLSTSCWKKWVLIIIALIVIFEQYTTNSYNHRSYSKESEIYSELGEVYLPVNCKYIDINFVVNDIYDRYILVQKDLARMYLMWFASEHGLYYVSGYSGLSEEEGYSNPAREYLQNDPQYCVITKYIKN